MKDFIEETLDNEKAFDIVTIEISAETALADYIVIASGSSTRHVSAVASNLKDKLSQSGVKGTMVEGLRNSDWVVIDAGDVIVHVFRPEVRTFYNIEKMWGVFAEFSDEEESPTHI